MYYRKQSKVLEIKKNLIRTLLMFEKKSFLHGLL